MTLQSDPVGNSAESEELAHTAWRWFRGTLTVYIVSGRESELSVRASQRRRRIHWDNRGRMIDGIHVWTAQVGVRSMPVEAFGEECRDFAERNLTTPRATTRSTFGSSIAPDSPRTA
jgi:hypothetical protein